MPATARRFSTLMMTALLAVLALAARPALAGVPDTAVADDTALIVWVDLTLVDAEMIGDAGDMLADLMDNPMVQGRGLPLGDLDMGIIQMQDFRDSFVEAGGEGMLLMLSMPEGGEPTVSAMVRVTEDADVDALRQAIANGGEGRVVELDEYAPGWVAVWTEGTAPVTKDGNAEAAGVFNAHLAERADAPLTIVYRMDDNARAMLDEMMTAEDPQMAMLAGVMQPLRGMDTAAVSLFVDDEDAVEIDVAMAFADKQMGSQFLNSFNGILMLAQGMLGVQLAELDNAPSQEAIAGFFQSLAMRSEDGGKTLRLRLGRDFFDLAEEMGPAFQEMMGRMGGGGGQQF